VSTTLAINEKNFETESFSIFCFEAIGLDGVQYTLIELIFQKTLILRCRQSNIRPTESLSM